jgi:transcriptional regulator with XRE-family HTH domain
LKKGGIMQERIESALCQWRESLDITREDIVRRCGVSVGTVKNAEKGQTLRKRSALQILKAINSFLQEKQKPELKLEDLGLKVS